MSDVSNLQLRRSGECRGGVERDWFRYIIIVWPSGELLTYLTSYFIVYCLIHFHYFRDTK